MPWARKKDGTHAIVVAALRAYGWEVLDISRAPLCIDLVAARHNRVVLIEVKDRTGKLTAGQAAIMSRWPGETAVIRSFEDVARLTAKETA
jgi:predicted transcriptional regulator